MTRELVDEDETRRELHAVVAKDDDGVFFVDYLSIHEDACDPEDDVVTFLGVHRDLVAQRIGSSRAFRVLWQRTGGCGATTIGMSSLCEIRGWHLLVALGSS